MNGIRWWGIIDPENGWQNNPQDGWESNPWFHSRYYYRF